MPDWRSDLVGRYPALFKRVIDGREITTGFPEVEDGWREVVERAVARIAAALEESATGSLKIDQIKQKFGGVRIYWSGRALPDEAAAAIEEAVDLAEARSVTTCEVCGREGCIHDDSGWLTTRCDLHASGRPVPGGKSGMVIERFSLDGSGNGRLISRRRYDRDLDEFVDVTVEED